ncbi:MAG: FAD-binding oxidoreductase [Solirubrobacterales bacterium]
MDFSELSIDGRISTPEDADWNETRQAWNLAANPHPEAVAFVESAADVAAVVGFARDHDLKVLGQGTGHGAVAVGSFEGTIVIKTERLRVVEVDPKRRTARVGAGVLAMDLSNAAQEHGLCFLPGSSPNVGVAGYALGGGLSWLGRRHGWACNQVRSLELVTADGEQRTVDADNDPELFWALRGGGGAYAIVTALHLELIEMTDVYAGALLFPAELGPDAVRRYRDWAAELPDEASSVVRFLRPPPIPDVPEPLRDRPLLTIDGASIGDQATGERLFAPMRELGEVIMDTFGRIRVAGLSRIHMDPEPPVPGRGDGALIRELPDEAIEAFYEAVGPESGSPLVSAELRQLGGAFGRPADGAGALSHLDAEFVMFAVGVVMGPEADQAIRERIGLIQERLAPWKADGEYLNFIERGADTEEIFDSATAERLARVKRDFDPDGLIRANHAPG